MDASSHPAAEDRILSRRGALEIDDVSDAQVGDEEDDATRAVVDPLLAPLLGVERANRSGLHCVDSLLAAMQEQAVVLRTRCM